MTGGRRDPQAGDVWRARDPREPGRTVLVLDAPPPPGYAGRVSIQTLTVGSGERPKRRTRTAVWTYNWHATFAYDRPATPAERASADERVGWQIAAARLALNLTVPEVAAEARLTPAQVARVEAGRGSPDELDIVAACVDVDLRSVLDLLAKETPDA